MASTSAMFSQIVILSLVCAVVLSTSIHKVEKRQNFYYQPQFPGFNYQHHIPLRQKEKEEQQDLSKVPGVPGVDFPLYRSVPITNFDCAKVPAVPGMYADVEAGCQAYHVCQADRDGYKGGSFLCTNGTLFNQKEFTCDWWYNVNCHEQPSFYNLNLDPLKNPYAPKKKSEDELPFEDQVLGPQVTYHGSPNF